jgi:hypothetical protein
MLKEALEADGLELPEEKPEGRARQQGLQAVRERSYVRQVQQIGLGSGVG